MNFKILYPTLGLDRVVIAPILEETDSDSSGAVASVVGFLDANTSYWEINLWRFVSVLAFAAQSCSWAGSHQKYLLRASIRCACQDDRRGSQQENGLATLSSRLASLPSCAVSVVVVVAPSRQRSRVHPIKCVALPESWDDRDEGDIQVRVA